MEIIRKDELQEINGGGGFGVGLFIGIGAAFALLAGFLDGFTRPLSCR